jgi:hypothetical protein
MIFAEVCPCRHVAYHFQEGRELCGVCYKIHGGSHPQG